MTVDHALCIIVMMPSLSDDLKLCIISSNLDSTWLSIFPTNLQNHHKLRKHYCWIIGGVNRNWVWCLTSELNEMVQSRLSGMGKSLFWAGKSCHTQKKNSWNDANSYCLPPLYLVTKAIFQLCSLLHLVWSDRVWVIMSHWSLFVTD